MPVRAIKLKLIVPRDSNADSIAIRRALWDTHEIVNRMVAGYERLLLEMRQGDVLLPDPDGNESVRGADDWRSDLIARLHYNSVDVPTIEQALPDLQVLYRLIVKSHDKPNTGTAQDSRAFHSPLCDPKSEGGLKKLEELEKWEWLLKHTESPTEEVRQEVENKLKLSPELLRPTGSPPRWIRLYRKQDESWFEALITHVTRAKEAASGDSAALARLRGLGVLPITESFTSKIIPSQRSALSELERMAFALAVAHMNSWESWGHRVRAKYAEMEDGLCQVEQHGESFGDLIDSIHAFEADREKTLRSFALWTEESNYRLGPREIRSWRELRDWLRSNPNAPPGERTKQVNEMQTQRQAAFGGAEVLHWLAHPDQQALADHPGDPVSWLAARNRLQIRLERTRKLPLFTFGDAVLHPRYMELDPPANTNSPPYELHQADDKTFAATVPLLFRTGNGIYEPKDTNFKLAPSSQLRGAELVTIDKKKNILGLDLLAQDRLNRHLAKIGGAALIFDRRSLVNADALRSGNLGSIFLKISVDIPNTPDILKTRASIRGYLSSSTIVRQKSKHQHPKPGTRILSVDLGVRSAAACSVFEFVASDDERATKSWPVLVEDDLVLIHERSFLLKLPGEDPGPDTLVRRQEAMQDFYRTRSLVNFLADMRRLADTEAVKDRSEAVAALAERGQELAESFPWDYRQLGQLFDHVQATPSGWRSHVEPLFDAVETLAGQAISQWRKQQKAYHDPARPWDSLGGKSLWHIGYLEQTRRLLMRWDRHTRPGQSVRRFDRRAQGTVAKALLEHINHLKEDRTKTTGDLIVQAARGILRKSGAWRACFKPVDIIVLEDLVRYRFKTDRPRRENSQLMRWSHRAVAEAVDLQSEVESIVVASTAAAFSSRFDALTGAPGLRCHSLTKADAAALAEHPETHWIGKRLQRMGVELSADQLVVLEPGTILPTGDGEIFATLTDEGTLRLRHADINAAQNLGTWFISGRDTPVRLTVFERTVGERTVMVATDLSKTLQGPIGGTAVILEPEAEDSKICRLTPYKTTTQLKKALSKLAGERIETDPSIKSGEEGSSAASLEGDDPDSVILEEAISAATTGRRTVFRDPSGVFFSPAVWVDSGRFWGEVNSKIGRALAARTTEG